MHHEQSHTPKTFITKLSDLTAEAVEDWFCEDVNKFVVKGDEAYIAPTRHNKETTKTFHMDILRYSLENANDAAGYEIGPGGLSDAGMFNIDRHGQGDIVCTVYGDSSALGRGDETVRTRTGTLFGNTLRQIFPGQTVHLRVI